MLVPGITLPTHSSPKSHFLLFGSILSPKASTYVSSDVKQILYLSPPSPPHDQWKFVLSVGSGRPTMGKTAFVEWQMQVLYMAQDFVAANSQAAHASAAESKAPSLPGLGFVPEGFGGNFGRAEERCSVLAAAGATSAKRRARVPIAAISQSPTSLTEQTQSNAWWQSS